MSEPDYKDDLVFPPLTVFPSDGKNLTDDWKAGKCMGWYFILDIYGKITPDFIYEDTTLKNLERKEVKEVLAPCDYEELKNLQESCQNLKSNYDLLQKLTTIQLENFDLSFEIIQERCRKIVQLRQLLDECVNELKILRMLSLPIASKEALTECNHLLTRINEVLK